MITSPFESLEFWKKRYCGWGRTYDFEVTLLGSYDYVRVVAEAMKDDDIVKFFRAELSVTPALCCFGGIPWEYIQEYVQVLVDVLENKHLDEMMWILMCLGCEC